MPLPVRCGLGSSCHRERLAIEPDVLQRRQLGKIDERPRQVIGPNQKHLQVGEPFERPWQLAFDPGVAEVHALQPAQRSHRGRDLAPEVLEQKQTDHAPDN